MNWNWLSFALVFSAFLAGFTLPPKKNSVVLPEFALVLQLPVAGEWTSFLR